MVEVVHERQRWGNLLLDGYHDIIRGIYSCHLLMAEVQSGAQMQIHRGIPSWATLGRFRPREYRWSDWSRRVSDAMVYMCAITDRWWWMVMCYMCAITDRLWWMVMLLVVVCVVGFADGTHDVV